MSSIIRFPIQELIRFYDDPPKGNGTHTTAVTSVIGEGLGAGLLIDYYQRKGMKAEVLDQIVTQGTNKGKRLDRWVVVTNDNQDTYYQVEIKNWAASAIGGRRLSIDANEVQVSEHKIERWSKEWNGEGFIKDGVKKVLIPMKPPANAKHIEPLACYWDAMHPNGKLDALFSMTLKNGPFKQVWIFSMSAHLRNLLRSGEESVQIEAPAIQARMNWLNKLTTTGMKQ